MILATTLRGVTSLVLISALMSTIVGCNNKDGPFERSGEKIDNTVDQAKEAIDDAGDNIEDATDNR